MNDLVDATTRINQGYAAQFADASALLDERMQTLGALVEEQKAMLDELATAAPLLAPQLNWTDATTVNQLGSFLTQLVREAREAGIAVGNVIGDIDPSLPGGSPGGLLDGIIGYVVFFIVVAAILYVASIFVPILLKKCAKSAASSSSSSSSKNNGGNGGSYNAGGGGGGGVDAASLAALVALTVGAGNAKANASGDDNPARLSAKQHGRAAAAYMTVRSPRSPPPTPPPLPASPSSPQRGLPQRGLPPPPPLPPTPRAR
jgi:hypothetical protein